MTLDEALQSLRANRYLAFGKSRDPFVLMSGGQPIKGETPALYLTEELAIEAWAAQVENEAAVAELVILDEPHVQKFAVTIQDPRGTHRYVGSRYAVRSRVGYKV